MINVILGILVFLCSHVTVAKLSSSIFSDNSKWVQRSIEITNSEYLFFYAEYCPYCEKVLPKVKCLETKVVGVATDKTIDKAKLNIEKHKIKFSVYWDQDKELRQKYGVKGVPALVKPESDPANNQKWTGQTDIEDQLVKLGYKVDCN